MRHSKKLCVRGPRLASLGIAVLALGTAMGALAGIDVRAVYVNCSACHGARGEGVPTTGAPPLAGLDAGYVERQLNAFATGSRGARAGDTYGAAMRLTVSSLLAAAPDRKAMADYVATFQAGPFGPAGPTNNNGRNYFNAVCGACHGARGQGNPALGTPRLIGLPAPYIARQLAAFKSGQRGYRAGDSYGAQMKAVSSMLPNDAAAGMEPPSRR